mmetsp:Transcript_124256/g.215407  ORF Transcript_124256/g.215407 Transcript_124256/m.215407 type:complete len:254 (-) Transcript_124256:433-1194(-)
MGLDEELRHALNWAKVLLLDEVPGMCLSEARGLLQREHHMGVLGPLVQEGDGHCTAGQVPLPHLMLALGGHTAPHAPQRILVHGNDLAVQQQPLALARNGPQVVAHDEGRGHYAPEGHLGLLFRHRDARDPDQQHVRVVPVSGPGRLLQHRRVVPPVVDDGQQRSPRGLDVGPVPPAVAACVHHLREGLGRLIIPQVRRPRAAVEDGPPRGIQGLPHPWVPHRVASLIIPAAIELEVVHTPSSEALGIHSLEP